MLRGRVMSSASALASPDPAAPLSLGGRSADEALPRPHAYKWAYMWYVGQTCDDLVLQCKTHVACGFRMIGLGGRDQSGVDVPAGTIKDHLPGEGG